MKLKKIKSKKKKQDKNEEKNHDQIWKTKTWKIHIEGCNWKIKKKHTKRRRTQIKISKEWGILLKYSQPRRFPWIFQC